MIQLVRLMDEKQRGNSMLKSFKAKIILMVQPIFFRVKSLKIPDILYIEKILIIGYLFYDILATYIYI